MREPLSLFGVEAAQAPVARPRRSAPLALVLSLIVPGAGHLYCGKRATGIWTFCLFAAAATPAVLTALALLFFILPLPIYIFACVDAFLTAREANAGRDCLPGGNPRIACVLNLMTGGFGYFYLGERKLGMIVFVVSRLPMPLGPASWVVQLALAMHAYAKCRELYPAEPEQAAAGPGEPGWLVRNLLFVAGILFLLAAALVVIGAVVSPNGVAVVPLGVICGIVYMALWKTRRGLASLVFASVLTVVAAMWLTSVMVARGDARRAQLTSRVSLRAIRKVPPVYPLLAQQAGVQGVVRLIATIGADGTVADLQVDSGDPRLVPAAMEAARQWVFEPPVVRGHPEKVKMRISLTFKLPQGQI